MSQGQILTDQQQAEKILAEFIEGELGDYSFCWKMEHTDERGGYFYFDILYGFSDEFGDCLTMRVNPSKDHENIEIDMHEDAWEVVESFSWRIKYFWMKVKWG